MPLLSKNTAVRRSLILAGGGVRLAYHAGVLQALEESELSFNHVDGTSGGIFGTAMLASGLSPQEMAVRWRNLKLRGFMGIVPVESFEFKKLGNGAEGIRKAIFPALGIDVPRINQNRDFDATFNVCNFSKKTVESIPNQTVTEDHLIAGMSLPMFMPATQIGADWYTDAVWIKDANLKEAVARGADELWLIWCIGNTRSYHKGYFLEYVDMIEISANAGVTWELEDIRNEIDERAAVGLKPVIVHVVKPEFPLPLDPDFFLKKIDADTLIAMGYADTRRYLKNRQALDFSNLSDATSMREPKATFHFRQQFCGTAIWNGKEQRIWIRIGCFVRLMPDESQVLESTCTVESEDGTAIPGFDNELKKTGPGVLQAVSQIGKGSAIQQVSVTMHFSNAIDFMLGLDVQKAKVNIRDAKGQSTEATFYQPAKNRIRNAAHACVIGAVKAIERWKLKWQTLQSLLH